MGKSKGRFKVSLGGVGMNVFSDEVTPSEIRVPVGKWGTVSLIRYFFNFIYYFMSMYVLLICI